MIRNIRQPTESIKIVFSDWYFRKKKIFCPFITLSTEAIMIIRGMMYLCFVFYNGTKSEPDRQDLNLSDLFKKPVIPVKPCLECVATMLNINYGHNKDLLEKCQRLKEYAIFVDTVRQELSSDRPLELAVSSAVDICIRKNILPDILTDQKAEVIQMILETYDKELHDKTLRNEGQEEERENGIRQLLSALYELNIPKDTALQKLKEKYPLSENEAENYLAEYWSE